MKVARTASEGTDTGSLREQVVKPVSVRLTTARRAADRLDLAGRERVLRFEMEAGVNADPERSAGLDCLAEPLARYRT